MIKKGFMMENVDNFICRIGNIFGGIFNFFFLSNYSGNGKSIAKYFFSFECTICKISSHTIQGFFKGSLVPRPQVALRLMSDPKK